MLPPRLLMPLAALAAAIVTGSAPPEPPPPKPAFHFDYDILPILQRQGCGSAYCHGSAKGRGGFKLSLFGSDPEADYRAITRDLGGRRLDLQNSKNSLLLKKPSRTVRHEGGLKLPKSSAEYAAIEEWIRNGAHYSDGVAITIERLELARTDNGSRVQARARFRQRKEVLWRDVTGLCVFTCSDERVCEVDKNGNLTLNGPGEAWVFARYSGQNARLAVRRSYSHKPRHDETNHPLDKAWLQRLAELGLEPSAKAPPHVLARRLYLDLVDRPPSPIELQRFLRLPEKERVTKTADRLLTRHHREFGRKFARHMAEWMEVPDPQTDANVPRPRRALYQRLREDLSRELVSGTSLPDLVAKLLSGNHQIVLRFTDPRDRAEFVGRAFLGTRIGCARCHNHPLDRWEQKDNLAFSAWFANRRPDPQRQGAFVEGILFHPETGEPVEPKLLPNTDRQRPAGLDHAASVRWYVLTGAKDIFYRNLANRVFAALIGRGLVEPLDDHRLSNPACHESLLPVLARHLEEHDLTGLARFIVTSLLYQQDSRPTGGGQHTASARLRFLAQREAKPLASAAFKNAVVRVLGAPIAERLPDSPLARQLALLNGGFLHLALEQQNNIDAILDLTQEPADQLREIFLLVLSRPPWPEEQKRFAHLLRGSDRRARARELTFALLASREFGSNR